MSGIAEVLVAHQRQNSSSCLCGWAVLGWSHAVHQEDMLTAAGFGPVKEAAAAGLRSVQDIWGAGGRVTVRMSEIRDADQTILSGEWDNHIKWNMADIAKERARAAAVRGEG